MAPKKKLTVLRFAKFQAMIAGLVGLLAGLVYALGGFVYDLAFFGLNLGTALAFLAIPLMPVYFAVAGFIAGLVGAMLYNRLPPRLRVTDLSFGKNPEE